MYTPTVDSKTDGRIQNQRNSSYPETMVSISTFQQFIIVIFLRRPKGFSDNVRKK